MHGLSSFYGLSESAVGIGNECGRHLESGLARLNPFGPREVHSIYLYLPIAHGWDCYDGQTYFRVGSSYRSPCLCQPPPPPDYIGSLVSGLTFGALLPFLCLVLGWSWDTFERRCPAMNRSWRAHSWRMRIAAGAVLHVIDHVTDLFVVYHFWVVGLYSYMAASAAVLVGYALATSLVTVCDSPLRPVAGDVVVLKGLGEDGDDEEQQQRGGHGGAHGGKHAGGHGAGRGGGRGGDSYASRYGGDAEAGKHLVLADVLAVTIDERRRKPERLREAQQLPHPAGRARGETTVMAENATRTLAEAAKALEQLGGRLASNQHSGGAPYSAVPSPPHSPPPPSPPPTPPPTPPHSPPHSLPSSPTLPTPLSSALSPLLSPPPAASLAPPTAPPTAPLPSPPPSPGGGPSRTPKPSSLARKRGASPASAASPPSPPSPAGRPRASVSFADGGTSRGGQSRKASDGAAGGQSRKASDGAAGGNGGVAARCSAARCSNAAAGSGEATAPRGASGLRWRRLGSSAPDDGMALPDNASSDRLAKLRATLAKKTDFTREEWAGMGVSGLRADHRVYVPAVKAWFKPELPTGLRWVPLKNEASWPEEGMELDNEKLAAALRRKMGAKKEGVTFNRKEWDEFGILDLRDDDYIAVEGTCFQPTSRSWLSMASISEALAIHESELERQERERARAPKVVLKSDDEDVKLLVRRQSSQYRLLPKTHELRVTLKDVERFTPPGRMLAPCGDENECQKCCGSGVSFLLGLLGAAAPFEAVRILVWDPQQSQCCECRGTNEETAAFGILRLVQAQTESAPMLYLVAMVFTFEGLRKVSAEQPVLFFTALISLLNCAFALSHFLLSPATEATHRARDELRVHLYDGEDEGAIQEALDMATGKGRRAGAVPTIHSPFAMVDRTKRVPPRRSFPMVLNAGVMSFFVADLTLRVVALCVFTYALGPYAWMCVPAFLATWLFVRLLICCLKCGGGGGYGYRDSLSFVEGMARDLKRIMTPSFLDTAVSTRRLSYEFIASSTVCIALTAIGLYPGMPHPHVDPEFRENALAIATASLVCKYLCFVWCVLPGLTLIYPIVGIGHVYTVIEETLAAIRVQRTFRYMRKWKEGYRSNAKNARWLRERQQSLAARPAVKRGLGLGRDRAATAVLAFAASSAASSADVLDCDDGPCKFLERLGRLSKRSLGLTGYVLTLGLCFRRFGESGVADADGRIVYLEDELETILESLQDQEHYKGGDTMAEMLAKRGKEARERAQKAKETRVMTRFADQFRQWAPQKKGSDNAAAAAKQAPRAQGVPML